MILWGGMLVVAFFLIVMLMILFFPVSTKQGTVKYDVLHKFPDRVTYIVGNKLLESREILVYNNAENVIIETNTDYTILNYDIKTTYTIKGVRLIER